jgi:hypothetical protein
MHIEKILQWKEHISDQVLLHSGDIKAVVLDNFKQRFVKKTFSSMYITEIVEIIRLGNYEISRQRQDASAFASVMFKVRGIVLEEGQLVHDCRISNIGKDGTIICKNDYVAAYLKASKQLRSLKAGQKIVLRVAKAKYGLLNDRISVNALPFIPMREKIDTAIFKVKVSNAYLQDIQNTLGVITHENKTLDRKFFDKLLHPHKNSKHGMPSVALISIDDLKKYEGKTIFMCLPSWVHRNTQKIAIFDIKEKECKDPLKTKNIRKWKDYMIVRENFQAALGNILVRFIKYEHNIKRLCEVYNTPELIKSHSNLWEIYENFKY